MAQESVDQLRITALERQMVELYTRLAEMTTRKHKLTNMQNLTEDMISEEDIACAKSLSEGKLELSLIDRKNMGLGSMRVYGTGDDSVFVTGSGVLMEGEQPISPVWGPLGVFPYLFKNDIRFYDGRPSFGTGWVAPAYAALTRCSGQAILVFNEQPWNAYWETAVLAYMVAKGFSGLHFVIQRSFESGAHYDDLIKPNVPCTMIGEYVDDARQAQVNLIAKELIESYCKVAGSKRRFQTFHAADDLDFGMVSEIDSGQPKNKQKTLGQRINAGLLSKDPIDIEFHKTFTTDIAIIITLIYRLANNTERNHQRLTDLAIARGIVSGYAAIRADRLELEPVIALLDCVSKY